MSGRKQEDGAGPSSEGGSKERAAEEGLTDLRKR